MRTGPKVLILLALVVAGLLVVTVFRNKPEIDHSPPPKVPSLKRPPAPVGSWNSKVDAFLASIESYYGKYDPHSFQHPKFTFVRYEYDDQTAVYLTEPHFEWVTKYEAHVLPVFEEFAFNQPQCLVIDVGANDGIYTQLSAGAGCKVVAFEMQDGCVEWVAASVLLNNVQDDVRIIPLPAYSEETTFETQHVEGGCSGTYSLSPNSLNEKPQGKKVTYQTVVIDNIVPKGLDITLLKVDVEGGDVGVVGGVLNLFRERRVKNLVVEIYAMMWPQPHSAESLAVYHEILKAGYVAKCLGKYWLGNFPTEEIGEMPIFSYENRAAFDKLVKTEKTCVDWHFYVPE